MESTISSDKPNSPAPVSHRENLAKLSRNGLIAMLIAMFIVPVATVLTLWYYLPPVSIHQLEASVRLENLETAAEFNRLDKSKAVQEPRILVKNLGDEEWTLVTVEINSRYKIWRAESTVEPGETLISGLDFFQTREGIFFPPGKIPVKHVRVYARLPSGSRATYEIDYAEPE